MKTHAISRTAKTILILLPSALAVTLFLFYIDEGAYRLGVKDLRENRGILLGNVCSIFIAQCLLAYLLKGYKALIRVPLMLVLSIPVGFVLLFGSIWLILAVIHAI